jgi:hypothetical protein
MTKIWNEGRWHCYQIDNCQIWSTVKKDNKAIFGIIEFQNGGWAEIFSLKTASFTPIESEYFTDLEKAKKWMEQRL